MFNTNMWEKVDERNRKTRWDWPLFWLIVIKRSYSKGIIGWKLVVLMALNVIISDIFTTVMMLLLRDFVVHSSWYARLIILVVAFLNGMWIGRMPVHSVNRLKFKLVLVSGALAEFWLTGVSGFFNTLLGIV